MKESRGQRVRLTFELAELAGKVSRQYFDTPDMSAEAKGDGSPITAADRDIETALRDGVSAEFPGRRVRGFGYALVACGYADAMVDYEVQTYDLAPMPVIIEEAGGRSTSLDGRRVIDATNGIASNGLVHDTLLSYVTG